MGKSFRDIFAEWAADWTLTRQERLALPRQKAYKWAAKNWPGHASERVVRGQLDAAITELRGAR